MRTGAHAVVRWQSLQFSVVNAWFGRLGRSANASAGCMARTALRGRTLKHTGDVAGFAIDDAMRAVEVEPRREMIEGRTLPHLCEGEARHEQQQLQPCELRFIARPSARGTTPSYTLLAVPPELAVMHVVLAVTTGACAVELDRAVHLFAMTGVQSTPRCLPFKGNEVCRS